MKRSPCFFAQLCRHSIASVHPVLFVLGSACTLTCPALALTATATTTTLAITSSGSTVTSVASGSAVTLTATVTSGTTLVTPGTVTFCDNTPSTPCPLATAQLTSSGTASITIRLAPGSHQLQAYFSGTNTYEPSTSGSSPLTVTGGIPTRITLTDGGCMGCITLSALGAVLRATEPSSAPAFSGNIQYINQSNSNTVIVTDNLDPRFVSGQYQSAQFSTASKKPITGNQPFTIAAGNFNGDGISDLAVTNAGDNTVGIFLGNGGGTFQTQVTYPAGNGPYAVATGDFNNDGSVDLAVTNFSDSTVSILLGKGDGTFGAQQAYATGSAPDAIAVGDYNGDGNLDLAVVNQNDGTVSILLGKGDGTFGAQQIFAVGNSPVAIAAGNFNSDSYLDLAVVNNTDGTVSVLSGNGDGTFQNQVSYTVGTSPNSIAVADYNSDGIPDLAVANLGSNTVSVLLGTASGPFKPQRTSITPANPQAAVAGYFTGSANVDLAVLCDDYVYILGNGGSGEFGVAPPPHYGGRTARAQAVGDWNNDGMWDLAVVANTAAAVVLMLNESGPEFIDDAPIVPMPGPLTVAAVYSGDSNYAASTSAGQNVLNNPTATALTLTTSPNPSNYGSSVALTATLSPYSLYGVGTNGSAITFRSGAVVLGTETLSGGVATLNTTALPAGVDALTAVFAGNTEFAASTSRSISQFVGSATLTVTGPNLSRAYGASNPALTGTASGALNGDTFTVTGTTTANQTSSPGKYPIVPSVSGTDTASYTVVTVNGTLTVTQATPAITWATPAAISYGTALGAAQLDASSAVAGSFSYSPGTGTVLSAGPHTATVTFTPTDAIDYTSATSTVTITVAPAALTPTIALTALSNPVFISAPVTLKATLTGSGPAPSGTVTFSDGTTILGVKTVSAGVAAYTTSTLAAGTHSITAAYGGDSTYAAITSSAVSEVVVTDFTLSPPSGSNMSATVSPGGQAVYTLAVTPPSGTAFPAAVAFSVTGLPAGVTATFSPSTIPAGAGATTVTLTVTVPGSASAASPARPFGTGSLPIDVALMLLPVVGILRKGRRCLKGIVFLLVLGAGGAMGALLLNGCGGGGTSIGSQQRQSTIYTLTVMANAGTISQNTTLTLTVE
jgi:hypothetical protein